MATMTRENNRAAEEYAGQHVLGPVQPPHHIGAEAKARARFAVRQSQVAAEIRAEIAKLMELACAPACPWWKVADAAHLLSLRIKELEAEFREFVERLDQETFAAQAVDR